MPGENNEPNSASLPHPLGLGQMVTDRSGKTWEVQGYLVGSEHQTFGQPDGAIDDVVIPVDKVQLVNHPAEALSTVNEWSHGPIKAPNPSPNYPVSEKLAHVITDVEIHASRGLALAIMRRASELGYNLFVVGGTVRDLVSGKASTWEQVNDLDMTGDVPPNVFASIAQEAALKWSVEQAISAGSSREAWIPASRVSSTGTVHLYRLNETDPARVPLHFLEYAPLKQTRLGTPLLGADQFLFGWDPKADCRWRDMTFNCLMFYLDNNDNPRILDPINAIKDLSVEPDDLMSWGSAKQKKVTPIFRPLPIPNGVSDAWRAKAVARLMKFLVQLRPRSKSQLTPTLDWIRDYWDTVSGVPATDADLAALGPDAVEFGSLESQMRQGAFKQDFDERGLVASKRAELEESLHELHRLAENRKDGTLPAVIELIDFVKRAARNKDPRATGSWPNDGVGARRLIGQRPFTIGPREPDMTDDPGSIQAYWKQVTSKYALEQVEMVDGQVIWAFCNGNRRLIPVDAKGASIDFDVREAASSEDLAALLRLFTDSDSLCLDPDYEAPPQGDKVFWGKYTWPSQQYRSRPGDKLVAEEDKTDKMKDFDAIKRLIEVAHLVEVVPPAPSLYWACVLETGKNDDGSPKYGAVRLTQQGRYERRRMK